MNLGVRSLHRRQIERGMEEMRLIPIRSGRGFTVLGDSENRERVLAVRPVLVNDPQHESDSNSQTEGKRNEIPQSRKTQHEDERAARSEKKPDKATAGGNLVHGNARMPILSHRTPRY